LTSSLGSCGYLLRPFIVSQNLIQCIITSFVSETSNEPWHLFSIFSDLIGLRFLKACFWLLTKVVVLALVVLTPFLHQDPKSHSSLSACRVLNILSSRHLQRLCLKNFRAKFIKLDGNERLAVTFAMKIKVLLANCPWICSVWAFLALIILIF